MLDFVGAGVRQARGRLSCAQTLSVRFEPSDCHGSRIVRGKQQ